MRQSIRNLYLSFFILVVWIFKRVGGIRYPTTGFVEQGEVLNLPLEVFEAFCSNKLTLSRANQALKHFESLPLVAVACIHRDCLKINFYHRVSYQDESDFVSIRTRRSNQCILNFQSGGWARIQNRTERYKNQGYLYYDPVISLRLPLTENETRFVCDNRVSDAPMDVLLDSETHVHYHPQNAIQL